MTLSSSTERSDPGPFLADFRGVSYLEMKGLHTFERDLGSVGRVVRAAVPRPSASP